MTPVGILLAAGRGRRFDPSGHPQQAAAADGWRRAGGRRQRAHAAGGAAESDRGGARRATMASPQALRALGCDVTVCPDADDGMAYSLVHALRHSLPAAQSWLIALGDMPHVRESTIRALSDAVAGGAVIAAPVSGGRRGNPVAFGAECLPGLLALEGDEGARRILQAPSGHRGGGRRPGNIPGHRPAGRPVGQKIRLHYRLPAGETPS